MHRKLICNALLAMIVRLTAYCGCESCCGPWADGRTAAGVTPVQGFTVAADPRVFPIGTILRVEGVGEVMVQDVGSAVRGRHLDLFFDSHSEARRHGVRYAKAEVIHMPTRTR